MQDSIVTCNLLFGKEPSANGTFRFTYSFMGDTMVGNILNKNNQVIERISAKKLKQSNKQNDFIGVYQYLYPREGMSVLTEEYMIAAFRFIDEPLPSIDSKDYYKDLYNSQKIEVGRYTLQDSIFSVYMLYGKHGFLSPEDEPSLRFSASFKGDSIAARIVKGEVLGEPMYSLRLE